MYLAVIKKENNKREFPLRPVVLFIVKILLSSFFCWLHICINRLNVVEIFEFLHHLVDGFTLFWRYIFEVVGNVGEFSTYHFETCFFKVFLNFAEALP